MLPHAEGGDVPQVSAQTVLRLGADVACGLEHLHSQLSVTSRAKGQSEAPAEARMVHRGEAVSYLLGFIRFYCSQGYQRQHVCVWAEIYVIICNFLWSGAACACKIVTEGASEALHKFRA